MATPAPPKGLGTKARKVWKDTTTAYELRADELRILEDACREVDLIERMEEELKGADLVVRGSMGQPVASPLAQEIRQHRATFQRLIGALKLPDDDSSQTGAKTSRSVAAREAANKKWRMGGA